MLIYGVTDFPAVPDHHFQVLWDNTVLLDATLNARSILEQTVTLDANLTASGAGAVQVRQVSDLGLAFDLINIESIDVAYRRSLAAGGAALDAEIHVANAPAVYPIAAADGIFGGGFETGDQARGFEVTQAPPNARVYAVDGVDLEWLSGATQDAAGTVLIQAVAEVAHYVVAAPDTLSAPTLIPAVKVSKLTVPQADYLVIAHPALLAAIEPLLEFHRDAGRSVHLVDVEHLYAAYSHGTVDAEAIHTYLREEAAAMGVRFVLLVGGDSYDYHDYLGLGSISLIPSLYRATGDIITYTPVDAVYADIDGDNVPDLALGRLPARTPAELTLLVDKTLAYATKSYGQTAVFAADDSEAGQPFAALSDSFAALLPPTWNIITAYLDNMTVAASRDEILAAINSGTALTSFIGHSGPTTWSFDGLLSSIDIQTLSNFGVPTVVNQWGCWNTYYVNPYANTLAHKFLVDGPHGAAAVLGSVTLTGLLSERILADQLMPRLASPGVTIGVALLEAKRAMAVDHPNRLDVLLGFGLLGDPALLIEP